MPTNAGRRPKRETRNTHKNMETTTKSKDGSKREASGPSQKNHRRRDKKVYVEKRVRAESNSVGAPIDHHAVEIRQDPAGEVVLNSVPSPSPIVRPRIVLRPIRTKSSRLGGTRQTKNGAALTEQLGSLVSEVNGLRDAIRDKSVEATELALDIAESSQQCKSNKDSPDGKQDDKHKTGRPKDDSPPWGGTYMHASQMLLDIRWLTGNPGNAVPYRFRERALAASLFCLLWALALAAVGGGYGFRRFLFAIATGPAAQALFSIALCFCFIGPLVAIFLCPFDRRKNHIHSPRAIVAPLAGVDRRPDAISAADIKHEDPKYIQCTFDASDPNIPRRCLHVSVELFMQLCHYSNLAHNADPKIVFEKLNFQAGRIQSINIDRSLVVKNVDIVGDSVLAAWAWYLQRRENRELSPFLVTPVLL